MNAVRLALLFVVAGCVTEAWSQAVQPDPQIGYVYPAGGQRGKTFHVMVGGQFLRGASAVCFSGEGVRAKVLDSFAPLRGLDAEERAALGDLIREVLRQRWDELVKADKVRGPLPLQALAGLSGRRGASSKPASSQEAPVKIPEHALLYDLEHQSLRELLHNVVILREIMREQNNQQQLSASVMLEITIDRDAQPGNRELRLLTQAGLTNPVRFQVGVLREVREQETPERVADLLPQEPPLELPVTLNGQIMAGDVDRFRFRAKQGQQLVISAHARELIPYLADAVPGWFQATLTLHDASGSELAFADDYEFSPDPVLYYVAPADGEYELEIRDALYRGRQDFVYRIDLGERPFITSVFPLGCRLGQQRYVTVDGWNLPSDRLYLDARKLTAGGIRETPLGRGLATSNVVAYEVDGLRAIVEEESNDTVETAQEIHMPRIVDGRIGAPGDLDLFSVKGRANEEIVVEAIARRVRSPLDALVRLLDADGNVVAWNDDYEHKDGYLYTSSGTLTQAADSYLRTRLPGDGVYCVQISDSQARGGTAYAYRLRVGPPQPDYELRCSPSSLNVRAGMSALVHIYALRKDGFDGAIDISLIDGPKGATLSGARIPAGRDHIRMTLAGGAAEADEPIPLALEGHALIGGKIVSRPVMPTEDSMQAFLYRHLAPADEMLVSVMRSRRGAVQLRIAEALPVRIPAGGETTLHLRVPRAARLPEVELKLIDPPAGITLAKVESEEGGFALALKADASLVRRGFEDNLIFEVSLELPRPDESDGKAPRQRVSVGVLPAVPIEIVSQ